MGTPTSSPDGFFWLWEKCKGLDGWEDFIFTDGVVVKYEGVGAWQGGGRGVVMGIKAIDVTIIDPATFPDRVREFLEGL